MDGTLPGLTDVSAYLELLDWRRRVAALFLELRRLPRDAETLAWFRAEKDALFRSHPQSPIPEAERPGFAGLEYWPFDPLARVTAHFTSLPEPPDDQEQELNAEVQDRDMAAREIAFKPIGHLE